LVDRLENNKQFLEQLNNDINTFIDPEYGQSPVIPLRPEYAGAQGSTAQAGIGYH